MKKMKMKYSIHGDFKTCQKVIIALHTKQLTENKWKRDVPHQKTLQRRLQQYKND